MLLHNYVQNVLDVLAALQRGVHHLLQMVEVKPLRHFQQHDLASSGQRRDGQLRASCGALQGADINLTKRKMSLVVATKQQ